MTHSGKVSGSRNLRKGSKKSSKKGSKKHNAYDFSNILKDMDDDMMPAQPMMPQGAPMEGMPQGAPMEGMPQGANMMPMMPQMGMDQMGMAQMAMPQMGMPQMMMGSDPKNVDPLHLHSFVPQNENININNYGVNTNQLMSGTQMGQQFNGRSAPAMAQNNKYYRF